jgi:hypothetical protein
MTAWASLTVCILLIVSMVKLFTEEKNLILFVWFQWFNLDIIKYCEINICSWLLFTKVLFKDSGPPMKILRGGTRLLWAPGERLRLLSNLRIWGPINPLVNFNRRFISKWWPSWLQCKCEWWSTTRIQKS